MLEFIGQIFAQLDNLVAGFMKVVFEFITNFWSEVSLGAGKGAYISLLLILAFLVILIIIGLVKLIKKFGLFIVIVLVLVGIPCLWYFLVLPAL